MKKDKQAEHVADKIIAELKLHGIEAYIWHKANTGSVYIRFSDVRMCSIRLGDHDGRDHLKYKYNLRSDLHPRTKLWQKDGNQWRCFLPLNKWKEIIPMLIERHLQIQSWPESKFSYTIPKHKQVQPKPIFD